MRILVFLLMFCCAPAEARDSILVLGDSLSAAHNMTPELGWVALLDKQLDEMSCPTDVVNSSISGETTAGALTRLPRLLEINTPSLVIIALGGNDGLRGFPVSVMRGNLQQMVTLSQAAGARVLIAGMKIPSNYGRRYTESFESSYVAVAEEHDTALLPFFLDGITEDEYYMQSDMIHPDTTAQPLLRDRVLAAIRPLLSCAGASP